MRVRPGIDAPAVFPVAAAAGGAAPPPLPPASWQAAASRHPRRRRQLGPAPLAARSRSRRHQSAAAAASPAAGAGGDPAACAPPCSRTGRRRRGPWQPTARRGSCWRTEARRGRASAGERPAAGALQPAAAVRRPPGRSTSLMMGACARECRECCQQLVVDRTNGVLSSNNPQAPYQCSERSLLAHRTSSSHSRVSRLAPLEPMPPSNLA